MRGLTSAQVSPGARTCIIVGALDAVPALDLQGYRFVLWFSHGAARMPARFGVDPRACSLEAIERFDRTRTGQAIDRFIGRDALRLPSLFLTEEATGPAAPAFLPVVEEILAQYESNRRARVTRQADGFRWQQQLFTNLPAYVRRRMPPTWAGALDGVPAFICGAGPSLDASAPKLAAFAQHGVVFGADSALGGLARHGVTPDFAVSVDASKVPEKSLPAGAALPRRVVLSAISPPAWLRAVPEERLCFLSGRQLTEDWLATLGVAKTLVSVTENCGITALELAVFLGCRPIHLFGLDHAVDGQDPRRWHHQNVDASVHQHSGFSEERNYPRVPGNYQDEIASPMYREWRCLDERCAALPAGLVVNVIDRGARLRNTRLVHPDAFSIGPGGRDKAECLARLGEVAGAPGGDWRQRIRQVASAKEPLLAAAAQAVESGARDRAVGILVNAFRDLEFSHLMGNYCLKVMPHLLQPEESTLELWATLVAECRTLIGAAKALD